MAEGFKHPKVKVHVGDGFKFLDDYKNTFDVIITDSSDPEGPAESLFQKPYFKLLHDALKEGGVITTQGCTFPVFYNLGKVSSGHPPCLISLDPSWGLQQRVASSTRDSSQWGSVSLKRIVSLFFNYILTCYG